MVDNFTYWIDNSISGSNEYAASIVYANNFVDNQNVIINNARIFIGNRIRYINGRIKNLRLLYNSLSNLNLYSLHNVENLQYFLNYTNVDSTTRYLPIAIFQLNGTGGRGYSEIQITADGGQNEVIKCSYDYENNFIIKGYYFNKHNYYHYKIDGNKIIIYLQNNLTNMNVNVIISAKSYGMFPINMNSLENYSTKKFIGDDFILTDNTGLTRISDSLVN